MSKDVRCPYCDSWQEINHDDGYGYSENETHQQECDNCDKSFSYTTSIMYVYEAEKADCLNDGDHTWKRTFTVPVECTRMHCTQCGETRKCTESELNDAEREHEEIRALKRK